MDSRDISWKKSVVNVGKVLDRRKWLVDYSVSRFRCSTDAAEFTLQSSSTTLSNLEKESPYHPLSLSLRLNHLRTTKNLCFGMRKGGQRIGAAADWELFIACTHDLLISLSDMSQATRGGHLDWERSTISRDLLGGQRQEMCS